MTKQLPKDGIDPKVYENVTPPKPEHTNEPAHPGHYANASELAAMTMADFQKQEESPFVITLPGHGDVKFKLDEVRPLERKTDKEAITQALGETFKREENFSVLFLGPQDLEYQQGSFEVTKEETGFKANMFLVPIQGAYSKEDDESHIYLEAIFS